MSKILKVLCLVALFVGVPALVAADSHEAPLYVWVNFVKAKPGQSEALTGQMMQEGMKNYDPLIESGAALDWGIAMPVVHDGNDPVSHVEWISFKGWEGADAFMSSFIESRQTMSPEDIKAIDEQWDALVEPGSHSDMINRSISLGSPNPGRTGYIHLGYFSAKPGQGRGVKAMWDEFAGKTYAQLAADGKILNYGLHVPALHRGEKWTHLSWYSSEGLAARDMVSSAFDAAEASRSEEENEKWRTRMRETFEPEHEDQILMVIHHKVASAGAE